MAGPFSFGVAGRGNRGAVNRAFTLLGLAGGAGRLRLAVINRQRAVALQRPAPIYRCILAGIPGSKGLPQGPEKKRFFPLFCVWLAQTSNL